MGVGVQTGESGGEEEFDERQSADGESGLDWQVSQENCRVKIKDVRLGTKITRRQQVQ